MPNGDRVLDDMDDRIRARREDVAVGMEQATLTELDADAPTATRRRIEKSLGTGSATECGALFQTLVHEICCCPARWVSLTPREGSGNLLSVSGELSGPPTPALPGWYRDPWQIAPLRWWDGTSWTGSVSGSDPSLTNVDEFVGGMNVPSQLGGRLNATVPCVRLTIDADNLRMHSRLSAMFSDFEVPLVDITTAFPLRGTVMTSGVGLELSDGQLAYFWSFGDKDRILAVLRQRGVEIDPEPRRALGALSGQAGMLWNRGRSTSPSSVARVPGLSPLMKRLMPLFIVVGIAVMVIFASMGTFFGWFVAALGAVGVAQSILVWRRSRSG